MTEIDYPKFRIKQNNATVDLVRLQEKTGIENQVELLEIGIKILKSKLYFNNVKESYQRSQRFMTDKEIRALKRQTKNKGKKSNGKKIKDQKTEERPDI